MAASKGLTLLAYMTSLKPRPHPNYTHHGRESTNSDMLDISMHTGGSSKGSSQFDEIKFTSKAGPGGYSIINYGAALSTEAPWNSSYFGNLTFNDTNGTAAATDNFNMSTWLVAFFAILAGVTAFVTIVGNFIVVLSFVLERSIRQPTNYFIASLALSDLVIGASSMPFYAMYLLLGKYWPIGTVMCDLWLSIDYTVCLVSQYTVLFITIDRFCSVKLPAKYRNWRTQRKVIIMVVMAWIIPAAIFFTSIIGWQYFVGGRTVPYYKCYVQFMDDALFNILLTVGYFWITLVVMCILYAGIYKVALGLQRKSDAKKKKMTSLVSMAGETMTKIGIGMSKQRPPQAADRFLKPEDPHHVHTPLTQRTSTTSFTSKNEGEDRSSSPALPSDTDPSSSQSPKMESKKPHKKSSKHKNHKPKSLDGIPKSNSHGKIANNAVSPTSPGTNGKVFVGVPQSPKEATTPTPIQCVDNMNCPSNHVTFQSPIATPDGLSVAVCDDLTSTFADPTSSTFVSGVTKSEMQNTGLPPVPPGGNPAVAALVDTSVSTKATDVNKTPEFLSGLRYIDQESLRSIHTGDNIKLLGEGPQGEEAEFSDSPIWFKRDPQDESLAHDTVSPLISPEETSSLQIIKPESFFKPISAGSAQLETVAENNRTVSRIVPPQEKGSVSPQPSESKSSEREKGPKDNNSPLHNILKRGRSKKGRRGRSKREKKLKSKSENRARKALRTITFILGAFVLCWTPYHILVLVEGFWPNSVNWLLYDISYYLCYLNSPINPFCYALANQQFKKAFIRILKFDWHRS